VLRLARVCQRILVESIGAIDYYYFMFRLDDYGKIHDKELFDATCALFDKTAFADGELIFWKKYLSYMMDH
jgi:hypothetical protein